MSDINLTDLVRQISQSVQNSVNKQVFYDLKESVNSAVSDIGASVRDTVREVKKEVQDSTHSSVPDYMHPPAQTPTVMRVRKAPSGRVSGVLLIVFGLLIGIPIALILMGFIIATLAGQFSPYILSILSAVMLPIVAGGGFMTGFGSRLRGRAHRFEVYQRALGGARFCSIRQLAESVHKSSRFVLKDLQKMMSLNFFPNAHIDGQQTCLMLDDEIYAMYLEAQQQMDQRRTEEEHRRQMHEQDPAYAELDSLLQEGRGYIRQIKEANDALPGEDISSKLSRLEEVSTKIFARVEECPKKLPEIRKFMSYYLPITLKLVNAYKEFESQSVQGENILNSKKEIQDTLNTINNAFENLLDSLFEAEALDVSTDISVLQAMLAQEGLVDDGLKNRIKH